MKKNRRILAVYLVVLLVVNIIYYGVNYLKEQNRQYNLKIEKLNKALSNIPAYNQQKENEFTQKLQQINIMIVNKTLDSLGSGVTIRYKGEFYILTAGHMLNKIDDEIYLYENGTEITKLEVIKWEFDRKDIKTTGNDLLLLKPTNEDILKIYLIFWPKVPFLFPFPFLFHLVPHYYTELAENEPPISEEVYCVGNPAGIEDVVTEGRLIKYINNYVYYLDHVFFGNSGGGLYNKEGKLIAIVSVLANLKQGPASPDYVIGGAIRLNTIKIFMEEAIK